MEGECSTEGSMLEEKGPTQGEGSTPENKSSMQGEGESDEEEEEDEEDEDGGLIFEEEYEEHEGGENEEDIEDEEDDEEDSMPEEVLMQGEGLRLEEAVSMISETVMFTSSTSTGTVCSEGGNSEMASIMDLMVDNLDFALDRKDEIEQGWCVAQ